VASQGQTLATVQPALKVVYTQKSKRRKAKRRK